MPTRAPGLLVAMLIAGIAALAARRLDWPDMLIALGWPTLATVVAGILAVLMARRSSSASRFPSSARSR